MNTLKSAEINSISNRKPRSVLPLIAQLKPIWLTLLGHFGLTCLFTYPLIFNFGTALPGELLVDRDQNIWNLWWVRDSLLHLRNPFRTDYIYYPDNTSLYFHTLNPLNGLISAPVQLILGMTVAYNFIVFFSFIAAGLGTYLLLFYLCQNRLAAFTASLIFVYAPYHIGTLKGLMQLISLEWLPFYILFLLKTTREPSRRLKNCGAAAFFLVLTAFTDWYYTLFLLSFTLLYLLWIGGARLLTKKTLLKETGEPAYYYGWKSFGAVGLGLGLFALALMPVLWAMWREMQTTTYYLADPTLTRRFSADLIAFFVPPTTSSFFGWMGQNLDLNNIPGTLAAQVYLGYVALGLAGLGLAIQRRVWFWALTGFGFWVLALGPALRINGAGPGWWMPFALIENFPIINITRSPDRFVIITQLCLAVCAAFGLRGLMERFAIHRAKAGWIVAGVAALLLTIEYIQAPYPVNEYNISPFFTSLGQDQADYSLVELPPQDGVWTGGPRMAEQAVHHKHIFDGYISREYDHPFQRNTPGFQELTTLKFNDDIFVAPETSNSTAPGYGVDAFSYYRVRYIILRFPQTTKQSNNWNPDKYRSAIVRYAPGPPVYKDDQIEVYKLPPAPPNSHPFPSIGAGDWYSPEASAGSTPAAPSNHRWASGPASLKLTWGGRQPYLATLSLTLGVLDDAKSATITLNSAPIWTGTVSSAAPQSLKIPLTLQPGQQSLEFFISGQPASPHKLGLSNDTRRLLYYVRDVKLV